jgi:hypothetical protein
MLFFSETEPNGRFPTLRAPLPSSQVLYSHLKKIEVIQLVAVLHDVALDLAGVDPGDEVLHVASNQESGIVNDFSSNADVTLLDESSSLFYQLVFMVSSLFFASPQRALRAGSKNLQP